MKYLKVVCWTIKQTCFDHSFYCPKSSFVLMCFHSLLSLNLISVVMSIHQELCYYRNTDFMPTAIPCRWILTSTSLLLSAVFSGHYLSESIQCVVYLEYQTHTEQMHSVLIWGDLNTDFVSIHAATLLLGCHDSSSMPLSASVITFYPPFHCKYPSASYHSFSDIYQTHWNINLRSSIRYQFQKCSCHFPQRAFLGSTYFLGTVSKTIFEWWRVFLCVCVSLSLIHMGLLGPPEQMLHLQNYAFRAEK